MIKNIEDESKDNDDDSELEIIKDFKEDPSISGINFLTEAIAFCYSDDDEFYGCYTFSINNEDKFKKFIVDFGDEVLELDLDIEEENDYSYAIDEDNSFIGFAWDGDKGIFIGGSGDIEDQINYLMDLDKDDQITSLVKFNDFYENKGDIGLFVSTEKVPDVYKEEI